MQQAQHHSKRLICRVFYQGKPLHKCRAWSLVAVPQKQGNGKQLLAIHPLPDPSLHPLHLPPQDPHPSVPERKSRDRSNLGMVLARLRGVLARSYFLKLQYVESERITLICVSRSLEKPPAYAGDFDTGSNSARLSVGGERAISISRSWKYWGIYHHGDLCKIALIPLGAS